MITQKAKVAGDVETLRRLFTLIIEEGRITEANLRVIVRWPSGKCKAPWHRG